jgi:hypothetical protein
MMVVRTLAGFVHGAQTSLGDVLMYYCTVNVAWHIKYMGCADHDTLVVCKLVVVITL